MLSARFKNHIHLHFIVFIWGFTAVLGKLITVEALPLVWFRMSIAAFLTMIFIAVRKNSFKVGANTFFTLLLAGGIICLHWVTFFMAIKVSNVSVVLTTMATGAFFTAILEPIWYKRKMIWYEIVFGVIVIIGLYIIFRVETTFIEGIVLALFSALLAAIFSLMNGKLIKTEKPSVISFYELLGGVFFLSVYIGMQGYFSKEFFELSQNDWVYIFILASACTAYAFIASVKVMKYISPYTVMLTNNLEPVYGMFLAFFLFGESEKMNPLFYVGVVIILTTVIVNGIIKNRARLKKGNRV